MKDLIIARISKPFGLKGELRVVSMTSFPELRFKIGYEYAIGEEKTPAVLKSVRPAGGTYVMSFEGIDSIDKAEQLLGKSIYMDKQDAPMPEGAYRYSDLLGMEVFDQSGNKLGVVADILDYAPKKTIKVKKTDGGHFYFPFVGEFAKEVDVEGKRMVIEVVEGML